MSTPIAIPVQPLEIPETSFKVPENENGEFRLTGEMMLHLEQIAVRFGHHDLLPKGWDELAKAGQGDKNVFKDLERALYEDPEFRGYVEHTLGIKFARINKVNGKIYAKKTHSFAAATPPVANDNNIPVPPHKDHVPPQNDNGTPIVVKEGDIKGAFDAYTSAELGKVNTKLVQVLVAAGHTELAKMYGGPEAANITVPEEIKKMSEAERKLMMQELIYERQELLTMMSNIMNALHQTNMAIIANMRA